MKKFSIEDQDPVTLEEIIDANEDLSQAEIKMIDSLEIGEHVFIGIDQVKRVENHASLKFDPVHGPSSFTMNHDHEGLKIHEE
ncbi:MAG: hypothetical protein AB2L20_11910 [Mangrovibacterium sp.]